MTDYLGLAVLCSILSFAVGFIRAHYDATVYSTCKVKSFKFVLLWLKETAIVAAIAILAGIFTVLVFYLAGV